MISDIIMAILARVIIYYLLSFFLLPVPQVYIRAIVTPSHNNFGPAWHGHLLCYGQPSSPNCGTTHPFRHGTRWFDARRSSLTPTSRVALRTIGRKGGWGRWWRRWDEVHERRAEHPKLGTRQSVNKHPKVGTGCACSRSKHREGIRAGWQLSFESASRQ